MLKIGYTSYSDLTSLISQVVDFNTQKMAFCQVLQKANSPFILLPEFLKKETIDNIISIPTSTQKISGLTFGGVDGGHLIKHLIGFDLHVLRVIAVCITFTSKSISTTRYYPQKNPPLQFEFLNTIRSISESERIGSINRATSEISIATKILNDSPKKLDILLMDGSPYLPPSNIINEILSKTYRRYVSSLLNLLIRSNKMGTKLIWIVKDSRSFYFTQRIGQMIPYFAKGNSKLLKHDYRDVLQKTCDMDLFYHLLEQNNRSFSLINNVQFSPEILRVFDFFQFYLKTAKYDIPLRVEGFFPRRETIEKKKQYLDLISGTLLPISQYNSEYGIPAPIVEADARVKIKENEINDFFRLLDPLGYFSDFSQRRRDRSPWKF
jgi:hypothetical protein